MMPPIYKRKIQGQHLYTYIACVDMGIHNRLLALSYVAGRLLVEHICLHPARCLEDTGSPPRTGGCRWGWGCHRWADRQSHTPCTPGPPLGTLALLDWSCLCTVQKAVTSQLWLFMMAKAIYSIFTVSMHKY